MAAAGIPGLAGFPAELLVFEGSWTVFPRATLICLVASGFTAVYAVRLFNRVGFGRLDNNRADWQSTRLAERLPAVVLTTLVVLAGIWPIGLTAWSEASTAAIAIRNSEPVVQSLALAPPSPSSTLPA
jgi:NAD(P)H-quinone oxidoreductase subunit 4